MRDLLMIVPTRGRPGSIPEIIECWQATGATADLMFGLDDDDPALDAYVEIGTQVIDRRDKPFRTCWRIAERLRMVGTLNAAATAMATEYRILGFMGDDHRPRTAGWDRRFVECLSGGGPGIVYGNDLLVGEAMPTAVAMTSDIVRTLGYMAPPSLVHLCIDLVWKDWGEGLGRITYLPDVIIEHMHPANSKADMDAGYEDANSVERVSADSAAYYAYRDDGGLQADLDKLKALP